MLAMILCVIMTAELMSAARSSAYAAARPADQSAWTLAWSDEFDGPADTGVNTENWLYDTGTSYPGGPATFRRSW